MKLSRLLMFAVVLLSPWALHAQREKLPPEDLEVVEKNWPEAKRTSTGLRMVVVKPGTGPTAKKGDVVAVKYVGKLLDGTVFDQAPDPANPFKFRVGRQIVIEAWDEAFQYMSVGEQRILIVPHELGYGSRGNPPKIPKRATLVFEVELLAINPPEPAPKS